MTGKAVMGIEGGNVPDEINGKKALPAIMVGWDVERQVAELAFDSNDFRSWNFVIAVLKMAVATAEDRHRMALAQQMQQQMAEHAQATRIHQKIIGGG